MTRRTSPSELPPRRAAARRCRRRADAHVTLQPATAPAGGFARLDVRVPNERDDAGTTKVDVQLPPGFLDRVLRAGAGLGREGHEGEARQAGQGRGLRRDRAGGAHHLDRRGGRIGPGEFQDFGLSLRIPDGKPGSKLTFKALQTYEGGEIVRWIGPEDGDEPAPVVTLVAADEAGGHGAPGSAAAAATGASAPAPAGGRLRRRSPSPRWSSAPSACSPPSQA